MKWTEEEVKILKKFYRNYQPTTSRFSGVSFDMQRQKWRASICISGKAKYLGRFNSEHEAYEAYLRAKSYILK